MIKILAACGAGVNSSHTIKTAIEEEMKKRGYEVKADAVMIKDINEDLMKNYDIFCPLSKPNFSFQIEIPVIEAGAIMYRMEHMSKPIFDKLEEELKKIDR